MKLIVAVSIALLLTGCTVFKSRDERFLLKKGVTETVHLKKQKARTWRTWLDGVGEGKVEKGRAEHQRKYAYGVLKSTEHKSTSRSYVSEVTIGTDTFMAVMTNGKNTTRRYNSFLNRKAFGADDSSVSHDDYFSSLHLSWIKGGKITMAAWPTAAVKGYYIRRLSPLLSPGEAFHSITNRVIVYNAKVPIGMIRVKSKRNIIYMSPEASAQDKKLVYAIALALKKSALRNQK